MIPHPTGFQPGVAEAREARRRAWRARGLHGGLTAPQAVRQALTAEDGRLVISSELHPVDISARELDRMALKAAAGLQALGVEPGDVIAFQLPMWLEAVVLTLAALHAGAVLAPIVPALGVREVRFILSQTKAKLLVAPHRWRNIDGVALATELGDLPGLEAVALVGERSGSNPLPWSDIAACDAPFEAPPTRSDEACLILFTSGTTSDPKGVVHTHDTLLATLRASLPPAPATAPAVYLATPTTGHIGGIINPLSLVLNGSTMVTMDQWGAPRAAELIERYAVEHMGGPTIFLRSTQEAAASEGHDISSLRDVLLGGTSITPADVEACEQGGIKAFRCYGSTEHPFATSSWPGDPLEVRAQTDGYAAEGTEIRLLDEHGRDVAPGDTGEIALFGPQQFLGYLDPALNAAQFAADGAFLTGDLGRLDLNGNLVVTGRKKDIIIRGGENISAKEVEDILATYPGVVETAAVAMPDARYGEKVCAFLILNTGERPSLQDIAAHFAAQGVAKLKTPERLEIVDDLPRTPFGKIKKFELRDRLRVELSAQESANEV